MNNYRRMNNLCSQITVLPVAWDRLRSPFECRGKYLDSPKGAFHGWMFKIKTIFWQIKFASIKCKPETFHPQSNYSHTRSSTWLQGPVWQSEIQVWVSLLNLSDEAQLYHFCNCILQRTSTVLQLRLTNPWPDNVVRDTCLLFPCYDH